MVVVIGSVQNSTSLIDKESITRIPKPQITLLVTAGTLDACTLHNNNFYII